MRDAPHTEVCAALQCQIQKADVKGLSNQCYGKRRREPETSSSNDCRDYDALGDRSDRIDKDLGFGSVVRPANPRAPIGPKCGLGRQSDLMGLKKFFPSVCVPIDCETVDIRQVIKKLMNNYMKKSV